MIVRYAVVCDVCSLWRTMFAQWCVCADLHVSFFWVNHESGKMFVRIVMCPPWLKGH